MKKDKLIASILTASMLATSTPVWAIQNASDFSDMPDNWSTAALTRAVEDGLMAGIDGKICADMTLTRAQMAAMVVRALGNNGAKASLDGYSDVQKGAWYYNDLATAVAMGIFSGYNGKLNPNDNITRQEVCSVLSRAFLMNNGASNNLNKFKDSASVGSWAQGSMAAMVEAGYLNGDNGNLKPTASITRAEFAAILSNMVGQYVSTSGTVTKVAKGNVVINTSGVTLSGVTVQGDLILSDGVGLGDINLDNVNVTGRIIVRGGGNVNLTGSTSAKTVKVANRSGQTSLKVGEGASIQKVESSTGITVSGKGTVAEVTVSAGKADVATPNTKVANTGGTVTAAGKTVAVGATAQINGTGTSATVTQAPTTTVTPGSSSSGSSSGGSSSGTVETVKVHRVSNWKELVNAADNVKAGEIIRLTEDITDAGNVDGVSTATVTLAASNITFDGNGHTIKAYDKGKVTKTTTDKNGTATTTEVDATFCFDIDGAAGKNTNITMKDLTIDGASFSAKLGGAVFIEDGTTATIKNVTFQNCVAGSTTAVNGGGAIFINDHGNPSEVDIVGCSFKNNKVNDGTTGRGGALYVNNFRSADPIKVTVDGCTFEGNKASHGGAIAADGVVEITVKNSTFDQNDGVNAADDIYIYEGQSEGKKGMVITSKVKAILENNTYSNKTDGEDAAGKNVVFGRFYTRTVKNDDKTAAPAYSEVSTINWTHISHTDEVKTYEVSSWKELKNASYYAGKGDTILLTKDITDAGSNPELTDGVSSATVVLDRDDITLKSKENEEKKQYTITNTANPDATFCFDIDGVKGVKVEDVVIDGASFSTKLGGALFVEYGAEAELNSVTFKNCNAGSTAEFNGGGAIYINNHRGNGPKVTVNECIFEDNTVGEIGKTGRGGAIYVSGGTKPAENDTGAQKAVLEVNDSTFNGNKASHGGAIAADGYAEVKVKNCNFGTDGNANDASVAADDIYVYYGQASGKKGMTLTCDTSVTFEGTNTFSNTTEAEGLTGKNIVVGVYHSNKETKSAKLSEANSIITGDGITPNIVAFDDASHTSQAGDYTYLFAGLTWAEYWANEGVYAAGNDESSQKADRTVKDKSGSITGYEYDKGGFDAVSRATQNHGLHRGSFQCMTKVTVNGEEKYLSHWSDKDNMILVGQEDTVSRTSVNGYQVTGLKYVPVAVKTSELEAFKSQYMTVANGETLQGGYSENNLQAYTEIADVDYNTNGLKVASKNADGSWSFAAAQAGLDSGLKDKTLKTGITTKVVSDTADTIEEDIKVYVQPASGNFGEFLRVDLLNKGYQEKDENGASKEVNSYGPLGSMMQAAIWTYYGDDSTYKTPLRSFGTKFAADNWMHKAMGIQLGLTDSARCQLPVVDGKAYDGTGYWTITIRALGFEDTTVKFKVEDSNIVKAEATEPITEQQKEVLQDLVNSGNALLTEYSADSATEKEKTLKEHVDEASSMISAGTATTAEADMLITELNSYIDAVLAEREATSTDLFGEAKVESFDYTAKVKVTVDGNGKILSVVDNETDTLNENNASYWAKMTGLFSKFVGKKSTELDGVTDSVSGATKSSNAVKEAVKNAFNSN